MAIQVALVMAPLLPRIRTGEGNMGWKYGGGAVRLIASTISPPHFENFCAGFGVVGNWQLCGSQFM